MIPQHGSGQPSENGKKPRGWKSLRGLEYYPLIVVFLLIMWRAIDFFRMVGTGLLPVTFESQNDPSARADLGGLTDLELNGLFTIDVPLEQLTAVALSFQISADVLATIGLAVCGYFGTRILRQILVDHAFTASGIRALTGLTWAVLVTGIVSGFVQMLGDNLVLRDLKVTELDLWNGISTESIFVFLGVVGGLELLRRVLDRGKQAEDDLEGVI